MDIGRLKAAIAFIDIEASGLMAGSFPVEVAWRTDSGDGEVLVSPAGFWDDSRWDQDAQAMHGLSLSEVRRKGRHPRIAAAALESAFSGRVAFSDSPSQDTAWADMIHQAGGVPRTYRIESVGRLLGRLGLRATKAYEIFAQVRETHQPRGRARSGVAFLAEVFEASLREVG